MPLTTLDFAKYPFTKEASDYIKSLDLTLEELNGEAFSQIVDRAEDRIKEALIAGIVSPTSYVNTEAELLSFTMATVLVASIADTYLNRRFALAESKRAHLLFLEEQEEKLLEIARISMQWRAGRNRRLGRDIARLTIHFIDYLRIAVNFHDDYWKLVNRTVHDAQVVVNADDLARLMSEQVRIEIEKNIQKSPKTALEEVAPNLASHLKEIQEILAQRKEAMRTEELPKTIIADAYPPCISKIYDSLLREQHISHMGRFTLTSFLLNIGMAAEDLVKIYTSVSDFSESLTRYQIEHIAGQRGSRTKYTPPTCDSLKTHGLCPGGNEECRRIRHPLSYYIRKAKAPRKGGE
jgi:DNA primase large subunit